MVICLRIVLLAACLTSGWARIIAQPSLTKESSLFRGSNQRLARSAVGKSKNSGPFLFIKQAPEPEYTVGLHDSVVLECEAVGSPAPSIHWLKDNQRLSQGAADMAAVVTSTQDETGKRGGLSSTKARLYLDCTSPRGEGTYTCVAETPYQRVSASSQILTSGAVSQLLNPSCTSSKKSYVHNSHPARITMWSVNILELIGNDVIIYCRTTGKPRPQIKWILNEEEVIENDDRHQILDTGDLLVKNLQWEDMGEYTCMADNKLARDYASTFLYPARRQ